MPLDAAFWCAVDGLAAPVMGTELMGPLLYSLVRSTRPRRVVEAGMGYTSVFIARAIADNIADTEAEAQALEHKLTQWVSARQQANADAAARQRADWECMVAPPTFAAPGFYARGYAPVFYAVDSMISPDSSAGRVMAALARLELTGVVTFCQGDFRSFLRTTRQETGPFDFIWNDAEEMGGVGMSELLGALDPRGGMLVLHDTLAHEASARIVAALREAEAARLVEMINILEPHKLRQNSATIVRYVADAQSALCPPEVTGSVQRDVTQFLSTRRR